MDNTLANFTDILDDEIGDSQPISLPSSNESNKSTKDIKVVNNFTNRPTKGTGQCGHFRSIEEIDPKYRDVFSYPYFNLVQSNVIDDALYSDKSIVVCAPTGSGKTVIFEMAIVQLLMELEDKQYNDDFKIIYMAPVKALCTERLTEWYPKFNKLGLLCIEVTGDTDVDFMQLKPYNIIITTPEKWDMLTRRWRDHRSLVEVIKLFLIDEVHILNDETRGPVLEAVVSRMKTIESSAQSVHRIELLQNQLHGSAMTHRTAPNIRFVAVSATVSNPADVADWLGTTNKPAVFHKFGDESRPVKLRRIVEGYHCPEGSSIFKFDIYLNYKLWPIIQKYHCGKPTLIFCNTRKSVVLTAETLSRELTINFSAEQRAKLTALASSIKTKILQSLVRSGVGCHHAGLLYEERQMIEHAFRNRDLPILITTTTLAMGVNLPAHLVIIKNTQQYVNGGYQEYSISTVLQMVGRAGRPQFDTEATAVIMTRLADKARYQALVGGCEPLQSYLHKRLPENLNSEAALGTVGDVAQCVQWLRSTFLYVRAARDPKKYLNLPQNSPQPLISKKIEELCVRAMNSLASAGLINMDEASCIESTEAGRLMSIFYLDLETMKQLMKIEGTESLDRLLTLISESHELADMHLRVDERRCLNALNRNNAAPTIRFPMKGKITTRQMKVNCIIQSVLGCLAISDSSLNQEAMKIMRIVQRICKCLVAYVTRPDLISRQPLFYSAVLNSIILAKCIEARLWENSPYVSKQLKGIGPTFSTLLATAGKINFMLLEESHPRDLERIMNKGAPVGNVIRKQISLLPKYQLSITPIDEKTVIVQLLLLNQNYLAENIDQLTAGSAHKCYIIVGDSNNHLLLLASFKDKDLLSVFNGTISHEIRRKLDFEHKIFAHCISTNFVGIDVQSEFTFNNLNKFDGSDNMNSSLKHEKPVKDTTKTKKQTCITDTFKERKRKSTTESDNTQSNEKKKRDNTIIGSFKYLKKTFDTASKNVYLGNNSLKLLHYNTRIPENKYVTKDEPTESCSNYEISDHNSTDDYELEKIDSILTEIENEMSKNKENLRSVDSLTYNNIKNGEISRTPSSKLSKDIYRKLPIQTKTNSCKNRKPSTTKSNYSFIDLLEKNLDVSDDDEKIHVSGKNNGFSDTIINQINKYINGAKNKNEILDKNLQLLMEDHDKSMLTKDTNPNKNIINKMDTDDLLPTQKLYPNYEIKEILYNPDNAIKSDKKIMKAEDQLEVTTLKLNPDIHENQSSHNASLLSMDRYTWPIHKINSITTPENKKDIYLINDNSQLVNKNYCSTSLSAAEKYINQDISIINENTDKTFNNCNDIKTIANRSMIVLEKDLNVDNIQNQGGCEINNIERNRHKNDTSENEANIISKTNQENINDNRDNEKCRLVSIQIPFTPAINELCRTNSLGEIAAACLKTNGNTSDSLIQNSFVPENSVIERVNLIENIHEKALVDFENRRMVNSDHIELPKTKYTYMLPTHSDLLKLPYSNQSNNQTILSDDCSNVHSNLCDEFNTESGFAKTSSYSATSVNVTSKYTKDYYVKVIKEIKVDMNITQIISKTKSQPKIITEIRDKAKVKNTSEIKYHELSKADTTATCFQNYFDSRHELQPIMYQTRTENELPLPKLMEIQNPQQTLNPTIANNLPEINYDKLSKCATTTTCLQNCCQSSRELQPITYQIRTENGLLLPKKIIEIQNPDQTLSPTIANKTPEIKYDELSKADTTTICYQNYYQSRHELQPVKYQTRIENEVPLQKEITEIQNPDQILKRTIAIENINEKVQTAEKHQGENEINKVQSILHKYSQILKKSETKIRAPNTSTSNTNNENTKSFTPRYKKPFKISDIQKLHIAIPNTIIDCTETSVAQDILPEKLFDNKSIIPEHVQSEHYLPCHNVAPSIETEPYYFITDIDIDPINISTELDLEPNIKIDQSMFDPKTLLQSTIHSDNEDIIPPPSPFCDSAKDCSDDNYNHDSITDDYSQCQTLHFNDSTEHSPNYNNIFDDKCMTHLTPSREIETWTLDKEDCWEDNYSSKSPAKSFTVMRRKTPTFCVLTELSKDTAPPTKAKLGQFKFNQKAKLRKWK